MFCERNLDVFLMFILRLPDAILYNYVSDSSKKKGQFFDCHYKNTKCYKVLFHSVMYRNISSTDYIKQIMQETESINIRKYEEESFKYGRMTFNQNLNQTIRSKKLNNNSIISSNVNSFQQFASVQSRKILMAVRSFSK